MCEREREIEREREREREGECLAWFGYLFDDFKEQKTNLYVYS